MTAPSWTWTVTTPAGYVSGCDPDAAAAAGWLELILGHGTGQAEVEIAGPGLAPLRITVHGRWLSLHDPAT